MLVPIGPVAVFTPSNFPLAFGVAGGDTASALAAGCPVIVKGHPAHGGTSEACARAVEAAAAEAGMPPGVLSLLQARSIETAQALVRTAELEAVAFTGSEAAGRAIHDVAASRPRPIPVYAEMGSVNPVFIGHGALAARAADIAEGLAGSITIGTGQFCTKPGLVVVPDDKAGAAFARELAARVAARPAGVMLYAGLQTALADRVAGMAALPGVQRLTAEPSDRASPGSLTGAAVVLSTDAATFLGTPALWQENFGPVSVVIRCDPGEIIGLAERLHGNLTATVHAEPTEHAWASALADAVVQHVGRVVWNGFPTGVAVVGGMCHGGPYPASTSPGHTSVGVTAIRRFLRPVAFQNTPDALLPEALRDANPLGIQRLVEGIWTRDPVTR
jgi:NADP-dependent aldehyde dehydrogenase